MYSEGLAHWHLLVILTLCFMLPVQCANISYQRQDNPIVSEKNLIDFIEMEIEKRLTVSFEKSFSEMHQRYHNRVATLEKEMLNLKETNNRLENKLSQLSKEVSPCRAKNSHKVIESPPFANNMQSDFNFSKQNPTESHLPRKKNYLNTMKGKIKENSHFLKPTPKSYKDPLFPISRHILSHRNINKSRQTSETRVEQQRGLAQSAGVAFTAYKTHEVDHILTGTTLKFQGVTTNIGFGYNHFTGAFTCPVAGTYVFFHNLEVTGEDSFYTHLMKNGVRVGHNVAHSDHSNDVGSALSIINLNLGDTVWIEVTAYSSSSRVLGWGSTFSGFLLYPS